MDQRTRRCFAGTRLPQMGSLVVAGREYSRAVRRKTSTRDRLRVSHRNAQRQGPGALRQPKPKTLGRHASLVGILFNSASEEGERGRRIPAIEQFLGARTISSDE